MTAARLILVWLALLGLLCLTIGAAFLPLGPVLPLVSYGIAALKAGLVLWFFMEMRGESGMQRLAGLVGFAWLALLITMVVADVASRT